MANDSSAPDTMPSAKTDARAERPADLCAWLSLTRQPLARQRAALEAWQSGQVPTAAAPMPDWVRRGLDWQDAADHHHCITFADVRYPAILRTIPAPPLVLFVRGHPAALTANAIALVGSRRGTPGGLENARVLACDLAARGLMVCSGLALGVDAAAHEGALSAGGLTVAVLGSGPDRVYPRRHGRLADRILERGALVSEFVPGTPPAPAHFPRRNRIISGLSQVTVVVEAGVRSGSLVTARLAAEQGREVGAMPGALQNPCACGSNQLLQEGAAFIRDAEDVVGLLPDSATPTLPRSPTAPAVPAPLPTGESAVVWNALESHPISLERLQGRTGWDIARLAVVLGELELSGQVRRTPAGYVRTCA